MDLKIGRFRAADEGQMELYLRWLAKRERQSGEEMPLGLILCAGKSNEHVELLELERSGIRVAEYLTDLPPGEVLERRLHEAIRATRNGSSRPWRRARNRSPPPSNVKALSTPAIGARRVRMTG